MTAGPTMATGVMDVSSRAAELLEFRNNGVARVRVEYVGRAPLEGSDDRQLLATLRTGVPAPSPSLVRVASARPFVPEISSSARPIRGEVPMPEGRPYNLGNISADQASISRRRDVRLRRACARAAASWKIRARHAYEPDDRYSAAAPARFPPMPRSIRTDRANCWPDAGFTEPRFNRHSANSTFSRDYAWTIGHRTRLGVLNRAAVGSVLLGAPENPCCSRYFQLLEPRARA